VIQEAPDSALEGFRLFYVEPVSGIFQGDELVFRKPQADFCSVSGQHIARTFAPDEKR
jgi:hypothetical protein